MAAIKRLQKEFKSLTENPYNEFSFSLNEDNIFKWDFIIFGPNDTPYEGGVFTAQMLFPKEYPNKPPTLKFVSDIYHPNVYVNGKVCISILHEGTDAYGYESSVERWKPVHGVASVILSVISMLSDPNDESPANIDAAKMWREDYSSFKKKVYKCVANSYS
jgi:ubiquitin-conjugating enzyme E2 G1